MSYHSVASDVQGSPMETGEVMDGLRPLRLNDDSSGVPYGVGAVVGTVGSRSPFL